MCTKSLSNSAVVNSFTSSLWILLGHELACPILSITEFLKVRVRFSIKNFVNLEADFLFGFSDSLRAHLLSQLGPDLIEVIAIVLSN